MLREIINYVYHLKESSPEILEQGIKPSEGLHIFIELDSNGNCSNFLSERGKDWDFFDGKEITPFLADIMRYEQQSQRVGNSMNKVFDYKKQISSCSPYVLSFKKDKLEKETKIDSEPFVSFSKIKKLLPAYFKQAIAFCLEDNDKEQKAIVSLFENFLLENIEKLENNEFFQNMKKSFYVNIYLKNISFKDYKKAQIKHQQKKLFNKNDYNNSKKLASDTFGLSDFFNGDKEKKTFYKHVTACMYKGVSGRIQAKDSVLLNDFESILRRQVFPKPLPIFIDEKEFNNTDEMIRIYKENSKLGYGEILKCIFDKKNEDIVLQNYYLLFFNYKYELEDYDFVTKFRYSLKNQSNSYPKIRNLFNLKKNEELLEPYSIKDIFAFERGIVQKIFNNSLVRKKENGFEVKYFGEINPTYVIGGDLIYQMILKYRKAFYDYIYKSKKETITSFIWDEILWNSILSDLRSDEIKESRYHSHEYSIKEKLNIWFSLYRYFIHNKRRLDMASKIPELLEKIRIVANDSEKNFESVEEFAFGAGQIIYYLLNQSKSSERTHALLEPFIQKVKAEQLQNSIAQIINTYKHELSFGHGRFERLSAQVLGFETKVNLKSYQRFLLAGYFSEPVIYEKNKIGD
jgi:CRISPR-associated protein Csh1